MVRATLLALFMVGLVMAGGSVGQDAKKPAEAKKDEPPVRYKGVLPPNWKKLGLSDAQVQDIYKIQGKYNDEIEKLQNKINELKSTRDKDLKSVLTADQKKRLDDILTGKDK